MSNNITTTNCTTQNASCSVASTSCCISNMTVVGNTLVLQQNNCPDVSVSMSEFAKASMLKLAQCKIDENCKTLETLEAQLEVTIVDVTQSPITGNIILTTSAGNEVELIVVSNDSGNMASVGSDGGVYVSAAAASGSPINTVNQMTGDVVLTSSNVSTTGPFTNAPAATTIEQALSGIDTVLGDKCVEVDTLNTTVANLQTDVTTLNTTVTDVQTDVTTNATSITTLETSVTDLETDVAALQASVAPDTFVSLVDNGDGTWTATQADGTAGPTFSTGAHTVDTDTDTFAVIAGQTITTPDGTALTVPPSTTYNAVTNELTLPDGTVVALSTGVDTFSTIAGQVITTPDGTSLTVPAGSTFDGTNTITLSDGSVIDLSTFDTDTDTFATFDGTDTITFANGTVLAVSDTFATYDGATNTVTFADGSTLVVADTFVTFGAANPDGTIPIFDAAGTLVGDFATGPHTTDTDTFGVPVTNPDGTVTVTFPGEAPITLQTAADTDTSLRVVNVDANLCTAELEPYNVITGVATGPTQVFSTARAFHLRTERVTANAAAFDDIDETTPVGTVLGTTSLTQDLGSVARETLIEIVTTLNVQVPGTGIVNVRPEVSRNGGTTWTPVSTGGVDQFSAGSPALSEASFNDIFPVSALANSQTYDVRWVVQDNNLADGAVIELNAANVYWSGVVCAG